MLEFFEDLWETDPQRAVTMLGTVEDDIVLETGDAELDDIERRLAAGEDPEGVLKGWGEGDGDSATTAPEDSVEDEFVDDYLVEEAVSPGLSWTRKE